ncbi:hypothetical protein ACFS5M_02570 [Lacinutrix iliipiscaria]|uniref:Outer membrane protein beta-barrel domain-containing protein n=1 Tax=Lacinutrix iliipiscaria TaxID=1230532 RepID=A0ABW5WMZ4_9FLAO
MKKTQFIILVVLLIGFVTVSHAQRRPHGIVPIKNGIGIEGGITQFDILTDNFETKRGNGWLGGASATVDIPHKWYNISYTIQLSENTVGISARPFDLATTNEFIDYKLFTAQIMLKAHVKIIQSYLTLDVGPMLQYNGELELKEDKYKGYLINNYDALLAEDVSDISKLNFNGTIGLSAGISHFRLKAQYIYGFTNMLNKLNKNDLSVGTNTDKFKGNQSMMVFTLMITL